jgi:hypothetical protein
MTGVSGMIKKVNSRDVKIAKAIRTLATVHCYNIMLKLTRPINCMHVYVHCEFLLRVTVHVPSANSQQRLCDGSSGIYVV